MSAEEDLEYMISELKAIIADVHVITTDAEVAFVKIEQLIEVMEEDGE